MNRIFFKICCIAIFFISLNGYALDAKKPKVSNFTLKVSSENSQPFSGAFIADGKLTAINQQTPFVIKFKAKEVRLIMGVSQSKPFITVELLKQDESQKSLSPLATKGTGHSIFICDSNLIDKVDGKNMCGKVGVIAGV